MDLVDEQDVAGFKLGEDGGEVSGPLEGRPRRDVEFGVHLGGDDVGEGGLAESWWTGKEEVVGGFAACTGCLQHYPQVALQLRLANEVVETAGPQSDLDLDLDGVQVG